MKAFDPDDLYREPWAKLVKMIQPDLMHVELKSNPMVNTLGGKTQIQAIQFLDEYMGNYGWRYIGFQQNMMIFDRGNTA